MYSEDDFVAANAAYQAINERAERTGINSLNKAERAVFLAWASSGAIGNGGFQLFFEYDLPWHEVPAAFDFLKLPSAAQAVQSALGLLPSALPASTDERSTLVSELCDKHGDDVFGSLERAVWTDDDALTASVIRLLNLGTLNAAV
jgi:hypothetical protein